MESQFIDVTSTAYEAGFSCPVYLSEEVWDKCVEWGDDDSDRQGYQEEDARLWDVLFVPAFKLSSGLGRIAPSGDMGYEIYCLIRDKGDTKSESDLIRLRVVPVETAKGNAVLISF